MMSARGTRGVRGRIANTNASKPTPSSNVGMCVALSFPKNSLKRGKKSLLCSVKPKKALSCEAIRIRAAPVI